MPYFQIESRAGAVFGIYEGETPEDAFAAMVADAGAGAEGTAADWIIAAISHSLPAEPAPF